MTVDELNNIEKEAHRAWRAGEATATCSPEVVFNLVQRIKHLERLCKMFGIEDVKVKFS
jgi:hypothetical protein